MKRFTIEIDCDNHAFHENDINEGAEIARILRGVADEMESDGVYAAKTRRLFDGNGNRVGYWAWDPYAIQIGVGANPEARFPGDTSSAWERGER